jgi:rhamnogalacturonyl hydrolase YesR
MDSMSAAMSPYARFRAHSLAQDPDTFSTGWEDVLVPYGLARAGRVLGDDALLEWAERWARRHHNAGYLELPEVPIIRSREPRAGHIIGDFCGNWGGPLVLASLHDGPPVRWLTDGTRTICDALLRRAIRFPDGTFAHGGWDQGRRTVWVDTMFYSASVLAEAFVLTRNFGYAEEAVRQANLHTSWLQDSQTGLYFHDCEPATGERSRSFWARGNGWALLALVDTLRLCPREISGWEKLLTAYRRLAAGLLRFQHTCGLWRIVPENDESHLETSGSAMIVAGLACGIAEGWIDASVSENVMRGWRELQTWIDAQGALQGAQRPAGVGGWETHKLSSIGECTYATGLFWRLIADLVGARLVDRSALIPAGT